MKKTQKQPGKKGKIMCLLSGGIDSPVAAHMLMKRGYDVTSAFFSNKPYASENQKEIALKCAKQLKKIHSGKNKNKELKFFIIPHGPALKEIAEKCQPNLRCILCKRMMYKTAEQIAKREHCIALATGESLGQVASQTFDNMHLLDISTALPVLRPLIGMDKSEITRIAREIGTFQYSEHQGCCRLVPNKPRTRGRLEEITHAEKNIDVKKLVKQAVFKAKLMKI